MMPKWILPLMVETLVMAGYVLGMIILAKITGCQLVVVHVQMINYQ